MRSCFNEWEIVRQTACVNKYMGVLRILAS